MIYQGELCSITNDIYIKKLYKSVINNLETCKLSITLLTSTDIYHYVNNENILHIITFTKKRKNINKPDEYKTVTIPYNASCTKYILLNVQSTKTTITKQCKKTILNQPNNNIYGNLYDYQGLFLMNIDANGYLTYYPDTMEIYDNTTIDKFISRQYTNLDVYLDKENILNNLLDICNYKSIGPMNLKPNIYTLDNLELQQSSTSRLNNFINWFNPLAYFNSTTHTITKSITKYYISNCEDMHIIKLENNKIKILRPVQMKIPIHVDNIYQDCNENIIFTGIINDNTPPYKNIITNKKLSVKYNKFLHNPIIEVQDI